MPTVIKLHKRNKWNNCLNTMTSTLNLPINKDVYDLLRFDLPLEIVSDILLLQWLLDGSSTQLASCAILSEREDVTTSTFFIEVEVTVLFGPNVYWEFDFFFTSEAFCVVFIIGWITNASSYYCWKWYTYSN